MQTITIGRLAKVAGVGVETVRFYERKGLMDAPARKASGYRQYDARAVERIRFIRSAQQVGFTLNEIHELLDLRDDKDARRADVRERATAKIADIDEKILELTAMRTALTALLASCVGDGPAAGCPIITSFGEPTQHQHSGELQWRCSNSKPICAARPA